MFSALVDEVVVMALPISRESLQEVCESVGFDELECAVLELALRRPTGEVELVPRGMHATPYNEQYLLNVSHWLDGLL